MTPEDAVLLLLNFLRRKGVNRVAETDLHALVLAVEPLLNTPIRFIQRPVTYSGELFDYLKRLERNRLVDELAYVHDGWVPKHLYEVTRVGHLRAEEVEDRVRASRSLPLESIFESLTASAVLRNLLPGLDR